MSKVKLKTKPLPKKKAPAQLKSPAKKSPKKNTILEHLNPHFGFFYHYTDTLVRVKTKFQELKLIKSQEFGKVLLLDGCTQVVEKNEYQYHEPMVHPALLTHPAPENVLIIGGGDGAIAKEVLKHPSVRKIFQVDIDGDVYKFSEQYLSSINQKSLSHPKVSKIVADGRSFVEMHPGEFDVVIMDMTDPFGPAKMLYTVEFFKLVKRSFRNEKGFFVMHAESPISRPKTYLSVLRTLNEVFPNVNPFYLYIQMYGLLWSVAIASDIWNLKEISSDVVDEKLQLRGIQDLKILTGETFTAMQVEYPYIKDIRKEHAKILTDRSPDVEDKIEKLKN